MYTYIHTHIHKYIHTYVHTYVHLYIYTYIYTHTLNFLQIFEKYSNTEFNENPFSGNRVVPCGRTDMTKIKAAFPNYDIEPKN